MRDQSIKSKLNIVIELLDEISALITIQNQTLTEFAMRLFDKDKQSIIAYKLDNLAQQVSEIHEKRIKELTNHANRQEKEAKN